MSTPPGALSLEEVTQYAVPGSIIYKVFDDMDGYFGVISKVVACHRYMGGEVIEATVDLKRIYLDCWFGVKPFGFLFSNYWHAYAYSLKIRSKQHA